MTMLNDIGLDQPGSDSRQRQYPRTESWALPHGETKKNQKKRRPERNKQQGSSQASVCPSKPGEENIPKRRDRSSASNIAQVRRKTKIDDWI